MTCKACDEARANWRHPEYRAACLSCAARSLAQVPEHLSAAAEQRYTPGYLTLLWRSFGEEWEAGHREVAAWTRTILA